MNPMNSSDWSTDPSWNIKITRGSYLNYPDIKITSSLNLKSYNFNISGNSCFPMYNASIFNPNLNTNNFFTEIIFNQGGN